MSIHHLFDSWRHQLNRAKAAHTHPSPHFLTQEIEETLFKRVEQLNKSFSSILVLGCPGGLFKELISRKTEQITVASLQVEREQLPFPDQRFDLVVDGFEMHWVNDVPKAFFEVKRILTPDGYYLAGFPAERTLTELRQVLLKTDALLLQGAFPRVSPFLKIQTIGELMLATGFQESVVDHEELEVQYPSLFKLIHDLRAMGETSCFKGASPPFKRNYFSQADVFYKQLFSTPEGKQKATFDIAYLHGKK
jgi:SAM-dependent methyltransferase